MVNLVQAWTENYAKVRPAVSVQVAGGGSGVGIAGLIDGTLDIAAAGRQVKAGEIQLATARNGSAPREFTVALDALAVYVNEHNPLDAISIEQLAEIYGERGQLQKWTQLGARNPACRSDDIIRVGRQNSSGTYAYFREVILGEQREYKLGSIDQSGSKDVVGLVSHTPCAIGYSGMAFATRGARALRISMTNSTPGILQRPKPSSTVPIPSPGPCTSALPENRRARPKTSSRGCSGAMDRTSCARLASSPFQPPPYADRTCATR